MIVAVIAGLALSQAGAGQPRDGYPLLPTPQTRAVRLAVTGWRNCLVYGIQQIDQPTESAIAIAEGAMAGCIRAETNLEDRLFDAMRASSTSAMEVRAQAHDMVAGFRERMRSMAIRLVLSKHEEARQAAH